jgi:mannitol/fructose-specific phosphotransferase system IIA component (Ntr-type)
MKLADFVCFEVLTPHLESTQRDDVIAEMVNLLVKAGKVKKTHAGDIVKALIKREKEASTGIGKGVAVPHVKHTAIREVAAAVGCSDKGIDFSSLDKQPVYTVFLLLSPADNADKHLHAMETIFKNLNRDDFRKFLRQAQSIDEIREIITDADEAS